MSIIVQRAVVRMCLALGRQLGWGGISECGQLLGGSCSHEES